MNEIDLTNVRGITCDSRKVKDGYVFVAIKGVGHDGHDYIADAIKNGASYIVQNPDLKQRLNDQIISSSNQQDKHTNNLDTYDYVQFIESGNTRRDLAVLAAAFYKNQPNTMIAVTGTNGKTSVADFVRQIFIHSGENVASIGTLGVQSNVCSIDGVMTTPDAVTLQSLLADLVNSGVTHGVMEASSHGLHQSRLDGVRLKIAAFTNLTQDHLDYHETMEQYFDAKMRLFKNLLPAEGIAIVNTDDPY
jgi:UDP-N-acetylmuramyl-tripeptide synthetase